MMGDDRLENGYKSKKRIKKPRMGRNFQNDFKILQYDDLVIEDLIKKVAVYEQFLRDSRFRKEEALNLSKYRLFKDATEKISQFIFGIDETAKVAIECDPDIIFRNGYIRIEIDSLKIKGNQISEFGKLLEDSYAMSIGMLANKKIVVQIHFDLGKEE